MLNIQHIGSPLNRPDWPQAGTIEGLLDALSKWDLDTSLDYSNDPRFDAHPDRKPFRHPCLSLLRQAYSQALGMNCYISGPPVYPDHPTAVRFVGNFLEYSFGFTLDTDDRELIAKLDAAIASNLERQANRETARPRQR